MSTKKRLIDANELVPYLWALFKFFGSIPCTEADKATQRGIKRCIGEIKKMPTVDAVEVVHGRWEDGDCTACGFDIRDLIDGESDFRNWVWDGLPYCPNCGADMRGDGNG